MHVARRLLNFTSSISYIYIKMYDYIFMSEQ